MPTIKTTSLKEIFWNTVADALNCKVYKIHEDKDSAELYHPLWGYTTISGRVAEKLLNTSLEGLKEKIGLSKDNDPQSR